MSTEEANSFNRWVMFPRACFIIMPSGSLYAWSMWQSKLALSMGVLSPAALDWGFVALGFTWSTFATVYLASCLGYGLWMERAGPRFSAAAAGVFFGSGHMVAALGCYLHSLPLIWFGYGALGGMGCALGYISPIVMLTKWFPDKKGLAAGIACTSYAAGGALTPMAITYFQDLFSKAPTYAGPANAVEMKLEAGKRLVNLEGNWCEAVVATATDLAKAGQPELLEGVYLVGTGDNGCMMALASLGSIYMGLNFMGAAMVRLPPEGWVPANFAESADENRISASGSVTVQTAMRTPQFYQMLVTSGCALAPGLLLCSSAHMLVAETYGTIYPHIVTPAFLAMFVGSLNLFQMAGRLGIGVSSDYIGCKAAYFICCLSGPLCLVSTQLPHLALSGSMGVWPLYMFYASSGLTVALYGGIMSLNPAMCGEVFGPKHAGGIYSRVAAAWGLSAAATQTMLGVLYTRSTRQAIEGLAANVSPSQFQDTFQAPISDLSELVDAKVVTIARLMEIAPPGTPNPTVFLYDTAFYSVGGLVTIAALSNACLRKMDEKYFEIEAGADEEGREIATGREDRKGEGVSERIDQKDEAKQ